MAQRRQTLKEEVDEALRGPAEISPPAITDLGPGAGYQAVFHEASAQLTVECLRQGRDGLKGDVRIEVGPFGDGGYRPLVEGRLELASLSQRETWERRLTKRWGGCDWGQVLDRFCAAIALKEKRLDRPAVKLRSVERPADDGWLLEPLLVAGMPTIWYGDGGSCKSLLGLAAAVSLYAQIPLIGPMAPARKLRVLFCDFEPFPEWAHKERMRQLCGQRPDADSEDLPDLDYLNCRGSTIVQQVDRIISATRSLRSEYLIVDSIGYAAEGPLNDDETARLYFRMLGQIGLPSLNTAHQPKNGDRKSVFGSAYWQNGARLVWHFQRCDSDETSEQLLILTNEKHSTTHQPRPVGLRVQFQYDGIRVTTTDVRQMLASEGELWRQVEALLSREKLPMTYLEIALTLGRDREAIPQIKARVADHKQSFVVLPPSAGSREVRIALRARE